MRIFQNYHRHSMNTNPRIADSTVSNEDYAKRAVELGHGIISTCEHGWQGRYIEGYELAEKYNLKFVFSVEAYWVNDRTEKDRTNCHIFLAAKNENGRLAINKILSEANITGFYGTARVDKTLILSLPKDDVIVTTACLKFWEYDDVDSFVKECSNYFTHFYLEVQCHNTEPQKNINQHILDLSREYNIPIIAGCDSHYIYNSGSERDNYILSRGISYKNEEGWYLDYPDGDTLFSRFKEQNVLSDDEIENALSNTNIFLNVENYNCRCFNKEIKMPSIYLDLTQEERDKKFIDLIWCLWNDEKNKIPKEKWDMYESEIQKEIDTVVETKHADYFLNDYYLVKDAKEHGGEITPSGRGSGVSFFINKLLGFTKVDRISADVKMYPERFMSKTRILEAKTLADLDMNLANPEVFLESQTRIFGEGHSYPMIAYGTLKPKAAWKMYARAKNVDFNVSNEVSSQIEKYNNVIKHAQEDEKDEIDVIDFIDEQYREMFIESKEYQGLIDSFSVHPCASLIYDGDIPSEIGLIRIKDNLCCVMDGHWAEDYKFLKNDLLKVNVVKLIYRIFKRLNIEIFDVNELLQKCENNQKVWDVYKKSFTIGINQVEQSSTKGRVAKYAPTNISELCAFVAAIRPGFKSMYPIFESRKDFSYGIKSLDDLIQTKQMQKSFILYQEIQMAVLNYAGIPMVECYEIIKNIAKKRVEKVLKYKEQFLDGFKKKMIELENQDENSAKILSDKIWQILEDSSKYSFNACFSGDTILQRDETENELSNLTIEEMYNIKNNAIYAKNNGYESLCLKYRQFGYGYVLSMFPDGKIKNNKIIDIKISGEKQTYKITTENGSYAVCTNNHKFPTPNGVKYLCDLKIGDKLYVKDTQECNNKEFSTRLEKVISITKDAVQLTYDVEMDDPAHTIITKSGLVASNSHSYCVAIDSLYGAYLKATYPVVFYSEFLKMLEEDGDKDRLVLAKEEAQNCYGIRFPNLKFRQDNRSTYGDEKTNSITTSLKAIKGFGSDVAEELYTIKDVQYEYFIDLLYDLSKLNINKTHIKNLIKIDYFSEFGNAKELIRIYNFFEFFNNGKSVTIQKNKLNDETLYAMFKRHSKETDKTFKEFDLHLILLEIEQYIKALQIPDFSLKDKIINSEEILGYISICSNKEEDRTKLMILNIKELISKRTNKIWKYCFKTMSIGSGKVSELLIDPKLYDNKIVTKYDTIQINPKSLYQTEWNGKKSWNLRDYKNIL